MAGSIPEKLELPRYGMALARRSSSDTEIALGHVTGHDFDRWVRPAAAGR